MIILGTHPLGLYPLGGIIVLIGADLGNHPYPYDVRYDTKEEFKATWGTMDSNYLVMFSDPNDYVGVDDPFWNPFNQDPVYLFEVYPLTTFYLLLLKLGLIKMSHSRTLSGSDLSLSGQEILTREATAVRVISTGTKATFSVHYTNDPSGVFRDIEIPAEGIFIPTGSFNIIDIDASTFTPSEVLFGIE
jgi:hypothetical protein